jgi:hypothetical protein
MQISSAVYGVEELPCTHAACSALKICVCGGTIRFYLDELGGGCDGVGSGWVRSAGSAGVGSLCRVG